MGDVSPKLEELLIVKSDPESISWRKSVTKAERMSCVIRELESICLEHDFLTVHFKEKEAVTKRWSDVITDVLSVWISGGYIDDEEGRKSNQAVSYTHLVHQRLEVSGFFVLCMHWLQASHGAQ